MKCLMCVSCSILLETRFKTEKQPELFCGLWDFIPSGGEDVCFWVNCSFKGLPQLNVAVNCLSETQEWMFVTVIPTFDCFLLTSCVFLSSSGSDSGVWHHQPLVIWWNRQVDQRDRRGQWSANQSVCVRVYVCLIVTSVVLFLSCQHVSVSHSPRLYQGLFSGFFFMCDMQLINIIN